MSVGRHGGIDRRGRHRSVRTPLLARVLRRAADLLALGADPALAWAAPPDLPQGAVDPQTDALLRLARRSASSGAALADG